MQIKFKCDNCKKKFVIDDGEWLEVDYEVECCEKCVLWGVDKDKDNKINK